MSKCQCLNPDCLQVNLARDNFCTKCGNQLLLRQRYRALKQIGEGGFGRTFLGIDEDKPSKPPCVIKQFLPSSQGTNTVTKAVELFNKEAVRLDDLGKHSQIPELLAHFEQNDQLYIIQEYIKGQNLAQELEKEGIFKGFMNIMGDVVIPCEFDDIDSFKDGLAKVRKEGVN